MRQRNQRGEHKGGVGRGGWPFVAGGALQEGLWDKHGDARGWVPGCCGPDAGPSGTPTPAPLSPQPSLGFHPGLGLMDPPQSPELVPRPHLELLRVFLSLIVNRFD